MSDFDKLKEEAEKEAKQHPQQVKEGEQTIEKDLDHGVQGHDKQDDDNAGAEGQRQDTAGSGKP